MGVESCEAAARLEGVDRTSYSLPDTDVTSAKKSSSACKTQLACCLDSDFCQSGKPADPRSGRAQHLAASLGSPGPAAASALPAAQAQIAQSPLYVPSCHACMHRGLHLRCLRTCACNLALRCAAVGASRAAHTRSCSESVMPHSPVSRGACHPDRFTAGLNASSGGRPSVCSHCTSGIISHPGSVPHEIMPSPQHCFPDVLQLLGTCSLHRSNDWLILIHHCCVMFKPQEATVGSRALRAPSRRGEQGAAAAVGLRTNRNRMAHLQSAQQEVGEEEGAARSVQQEALHLRPLVRPQLLHQLRQEEGHLRHITAKM